MKCDICDMTFTQKRSLTRHMKHRPERCRLMEIKLHEYAIKIRDEVMKKMLLQIQDMKTVKKGFIYLIQEREFIKTEEPIFKIGMTERKNPFLKIAAYPKNSRIYIIRNVDDHVEWYGESIKKIETSLINLFKTEFVQRRDIGNEYFQGDHTKMLEFISSIKGYNIDVSDWNKQET